MGTKLKLAGVIPESYTDGTGIRYTIFVQGCKHHCKNCHNPETWDFNAGKSVDIDILYDDIIANKMLDGVTFSGGDPMFQAKSCAELAKKLKENTNLNIWVYTGFKLEDIWDNEEYAELLKYADILVDGRYQDECRNLTLKFRGSSNQRIINLKESKKNGRIVLEIQ